MITRALLDFIQREQSTGATREALAVKLKEKGWGDADIDSAFSFLSDFSDHEVPVPRVGLSADFAEILKLMWRVFCSRWKRFFGAGLLYIWACFLLALSIAMLALPSIPTFLKLVWLGDKTSAFFLMAPYLFLGICVYILLQLWYLGTLYAIALKKGESLWERAHEGISHLPAVLGIKVVSALLVMILFVPLFLVTFLTQNILVLVFFGPLFVMGAVVLGFFLSLAIPAYFQGVKWRDAALESMRVVHRNALSLVAFYIFFGILAFLFAVLFQHTGPIAILFAVGVVSPMEVLFMLILYRRFVAERHAPATLPPTETKKKTQKTASVLPA